MQRAETRQLKIHSVLFNCSHLNVMYMTVTVMVINIAVLGVRKPFSIWCDHHLPHAVQHISFA